MNDGVMSKLNDPTKSIAIDFVGCVKNEDDMVSKLNDPTKSIAIDFVGHVEMGDD